MTNRPGGMIRPFQAELSGMVRLLDIGLIVLTLLLALHMAGHRWYRFYDPVALIGVTFFYLTGEFFAVYRSWRLERLWVESGQILLAWLTAAAMLLFVGYATKTTQQYSRLAIGWWVFLVPIALVAWRAVVRAILNQLRKKGFNSRGVAIVGTGKLGLRCARAITNLPQLGLMVLGFYDDRRYPRAEVPPDSGYALRGTHADLIERARRAEVDVVYITYPLVAEERTRDLIEALSDTTVSVYVVPDTFVFNLSHGRWVQLGEVAAVGLFETPFVGLNALSKRLLDLEIAIVSLAFLAVPMLVIAIGIKLSSPGPVIFRQRRYGLDGREFRILKFRTMYETDADEVVPQARRDDPRVTRVGRFLRRTSLDELPQLFNVLIGSMSVVGPRPHALPHNEWYRKRIRSYMIRHKVKPGITGWAQVNGLRGNTAREELMRERVEFDLWYIRNWSLMLDLLILAKTIPTLVRSRNAF